jgi:hypothetical protein
MIPPQNQWCHQIAVTSACWPKPACSNCTRLLGHERKRYYMSPDQFESVVKVAAAFIKHSNTDIGQLVNRAGLSVEAKVRKKVLGIFGGEPLMHPQFPELVDILNHYVPEKFNRGLWTSFDWANGESKVWGKYRDQVERLLGKKPNGSVFSYESGYLNWNMHEETQPCEHSPVLAASQDLIKDEKKRWEVISKCWVQTEWSAAYALDYNNEPKFYFCEVASAFDRVFNLGTGLAVEPGVWSHHLWFEEQDGVLRPQGLYAKQILSTCNRCGSCLKLPGRRDREFVDDISKSNLVPLTVLGSPMVKKGQYSEVEADYYESAEEQTKTETPWEYQKDARRQQLENFRKANWLHAHQKEGG